MKYDVFVFALLFTITNTLINDSCRGIKKSKIIKAPPTNYNADEGSCTIFQWTYCNSPKASITGIIIFRRLARQRPSYLVALGVTGKPVFSQPSYQYLYNITWTQENASITFRIKRTSVEDAGYYILEIRRVAYADLQNRVNLIVHEAVSASLTMLVTHPFVAITKTSEQITSLTKRPSDHTISRVSPSLTMLETHPLVTISKTSDSITSVTKSPSHHTSSRVLMRGVPTTNRQENCSSKVNNNLRVSKKHTVKENKEKFDNIEILILCILAGLAPIALFSLVIAFYKLRRRRKKRTKNHRKMTHITLANTELEETSSMIHFQRGGTNSDEFDNNFNASSMSGFSYRDSLEHDGFSDQEPPSTITFGITQSMSSAHQSDVNFKSRVIQDVNSPLLPPRKKFELERESIRDMEIVGQGAFGLVAKAKLFHYNGQRTVAIKMLKDFASSEDRRDLIGECILMKRLNPHKNVVQLLGYVLKSGALNFILQLEKMS